MKLANNEPIISFKPDPSKFLRHIPALFGPIPEYYEVNKEPLIRLFHTKEYYEDQIGFDSETKIVQRPELFIYQDLCLINSFFPFTATIEISDNEEIDFMEWANEMFLGEFHETREKNAFFIEETEKYLVNVNIKNWDELSIGFIVPSISKVVSCLLSSMRRNSEGLEMVFYYFALCDFSQNPNMRNLVLNVFNDFFIEHEDAEIFRFFECMLFYNFGTNSCFAFNKTIFPINLIDSWTDKEFIINFLDGDQIRVSMLQDFINKEQSNASAFEIIDNNNSKIVYFKHIYTDLDNFKKRFIFKVKNLIYFTQKAQTYLGITTDYYSDPYVTHVYKDDYYSQELSEKEKMSAYEDYLFYMNKFHEILSYKMLNNLNLCQNTSFMKSFIDQRIYIMINDASVEGFRLINDSFLDIILDDKTIPQSLNSLTKLSEFQILTFLFNIDIMSNDDFSLLTEDGVVIDYRIFNHEPCYMPIQVDDLLKGDFFVLVKTSFQVLFNFIFSRKRDVQTTEDEYLEMFEQIPVCECAVSKEILPLLLYEMWASKLQQRKALILTYISFRNIFERIIDFLRAKNLFVLDQDHSIVSNLILKFIETNKEEVFKLDMMSVEPKLEFDSKYFEKFIKILSLKIDELIMKMSHSINIFKCYRIFECSTTKYYGIEDKQVGSTANPDFDDEFRLLFVILDIEKNDNEFESLEQRLIGHYQSEKIEKMIIYRFMSIFSFELFTNVMDKKICYQKISNEPFLSNDANAPFFEKNILSIYRSHD